MEILFSLLLLLLAIFLRVTSVLLSNPLHPIVDLPIGKLQGSVAQSFKGRNFYQFEGVPFARAPVGDLRFEEPRPIGSWNGIRVANKRIKCLQYNGLFPLENGEYEIQGEEDCLYLNVYTPSLNILKKLDVIVYIHGGAFMFSSGAEYRPDFILDRDVVFVTINYRLGPLGFLSTESDLIPGNNGIKDQIAALQFIQKYIKHFGGNPNSVTITGASAGGVSVHLHSLIKQSHGLFHRGISRSGTALNPWGIMEAPLEKTLKLASKIGCPTSPITKSIECLKAKPGRDVVHAVKYFQPFLYNPEQPWGVVVDTWASKPVLGEHPYLILRKGKINDVPMIISYVNKEGMDPGSSLYDENALREVNARFSELMPYIMEYNYTIATELKKVVGDKIRKFYFKDEEITRTNFKTLIKALSERHYLTDIFKTINLQKKVTKSGIYVYHFKYQGADSLYSDITHNEPGWGAGHYEDTPYIFKMNSMNTTKTENDRRVTEIFLEMYISFAKYGKPIIRGHKWPAVSRLGADYETTGLTFDQGPELKIEYLSPDNWQFWESLPFMENEKLIKKR